MAQLALSIFIKHTIKVLHVVLGGALLVGLMSTGLAFAQDTEGESFLIEEIACEGNSVTRCSFILGKYYQRVGEFVDAEKIADARIRLNTMPQFYHARARLDKGSQKGRVSVVFIVIEAPRFNYDLTSLARGSSRQRYHWKDDTRSLSNSVKVSNNNFLGAGKTLALGVSYSNRTSKDTYDSRVIIGGEQLREVESNSQGKSIGVEYLDPYLFGSSNYFAELSAYSSINKTKTRKIYITENGEGIGLADTIVSPTEFSREDNSEFYSASLGRNIKRFSYVDLSLRKQSGFNPSASIGFGWNTEDYLDFATSGDRFDFRVTSADDVKYASLSYAKNMAIRSNQVFTFSGSVNTFHTDYSSQSYSLAAEYNFANELIRSKGAFTGWFISSRITRNEGPSFGADSIGLVAGLRHQARAINMIIDFSYSHYEDQK